MKDINITHKLLKFQSIQNNQKYLSQKAQMKRAAKEKKPKNEN